MSTISVGPTNLNQVPAVKAEQNMPTLHTNIQASDVKPELTLSKPAVTTEDKLEKIAADKEETAPPPKKIDYKAELKNIQRKFAIKTAIGAGIGLIGGAILKNPLRGALIGAGIAGVEDAIERSQNKNILDKSELHTAISAVVAVGLTIPSKVKLLTKAFDPIALLGVTALGSSAVKLAEKYNPFKKAETKET